MKSRTTAAAALAATAALALAACSAGSDDNGSTGGDSAGGATLTLGILGEPTSWDPAQAHVGHALQPYQAVYDSLILREPDGTLSPMLATQWEWTDDARTVLTMDLRTDVTFSDGAAFDADAVVANITHFQEDNGPQANQAASLEEVVAVDEDSVEFTLSRPDASFEYFLSQALGLMGSPEALGTDDMDTLPVGTGPYVMDGGQSIPGSQYVMTARDGYWGADLQKWDQITLRVLVDSAARANAVSAGEVDAVLLDATTYDQGEQSGYTLLEYPTDWSGMMLFDREGVLNPALADVRVRQAINYAFDRQSLLDQVAGGFGEVTSQVFGPDSSAYLPELDDYYAYDPDKARELLAEAGYADGLTITMPLLAPNFETLTAFVVQQLGDVGITVETTAVTQQEYLDVLRAGKYPMAVFNLFQGPTSVAYTQLLATGAAYNPFATTTPEIDAAAEAINAGGDDADSAAQDLNRYITENAWFVPWYRPSQLYFYDADKVQVEAQIQMAVPSIYNYTPAS